MLVLNHVTKWFEERLGLDSLPFFKTPKYMFRTSYWTGALVAAAFALTFVTGLLLLFYYNPSNPYDQTQYLITQVPYGAVLLYTHLYSAYAMILLVYIHLYRNYMAGAYKKPRELLWIIGLLMFVSLLAASFVGYSLVGDVLSINAIDVAKGLIAAAPGGGAVLPLLFGNGTTIGLFTEMLGWHILLVTLIAALFVFHFYLAERYGMTPSLRDKPRAPAVYSKSEESTFTRWWPANFIYMLSVVFITWGFLLFVPNALALFNNLPAVISPQPAPSPMSPAAVNIVPYPPWFFLFFYKIADFLNPGGSAYSPLEVMAVSALIPFIFLLLLPFLDRGDEINPFGKQRRFFTWLFSLMFILLIELSVWGFVAPGVPASFITQAALLLPPVAICGAAIFLIEGRGRGRRRFTAGPRGILALVFLALLLVGTLGGLIQYPMVYTTGVVLSVLFVLVVYIKRSDVLLADSDADDPTADGARLKQARRSAAARQAQRVRTAEWLAAVLLLMSFAIAGALWTVPCTGPMEPYFGIGLGAVLLMLGEAVSLYHHVTLNGESVEGGRGGSNRADAAQH